MTQHRCRWIVTLLLFWIATPLLAQDKPALIKQIGNEIPVKYDAEAMQFTPDGKTLFANTGGIIFLIDVATATIKAPGIQGPHSETGMDRPADMLPVVAGAYELARDAAFSADGKKLLVATSRTTQWWDVNKGTSLTRPIPFGAPHNPTIVSPAGDVFLVSYSEWSFRPGHPEPRPMMGTMWNALRGTRTSKPLPLDINMIPGDRNKWDLAQVAFSPDQKLLAIVHNTGMVRLFDWKKGKELVKGGLAPVDAEVGGKTRLVWSPDSKRLLVHSEKGVQLWDAEALVKVGDPFVIPPISGAFPDRRFRAAFSSNSATLALPCLGAAREPRVHDVQFIETKTGQKTGQFSPNGKIHDFAIAKMEYVGDSLLVIPNPSIANQKLPWLWNPTTGKGLAEPPELLPIQSAVVSPDGKYVATFGKSKKNLAQNAISLWAFP